MASMNALMVHKENARPPALIQANAAGKIRSSLAENHRVFEKGDSHRSEMDRLHYQGVKLQSLLVQRTAPTTNS